MAEKKQRRSEEAVSGLYSPMPHMVMDSIAYQSLSYPAKALLFELNRQHNGRNNNGHLHLSFSWLADRGWKSRDVIQRARIELEKNGLIIQTRQGGLNIGASRYAVTWIKITNFVGLDIQAKDYHPGAWALMNDLSISRKITNAVPLNGKGNTFCRDSPVPPAGTA